MRIVCVLFIVLTGIQRMSAQQVTPPASSPESSKIAAIAGGHPISVARVAQHLKKTLGKREIPEPFAEQAKGEALEHLIRRHAVFAAIKKSGLNVGRSRVLMELEKLNDRLKEVDQTLEDYLETSGMNREELEYEFEWRIAWRQYLETNLTEERLVRFYESHRRQFDGTEIKVAHLLIQNLKQDVRVNKKQAIQIKDEIESGKISWNEAVKTYSEATSSSDEGGEIGWISYEGPMPPEFCRVAIELQMGQISPPVETIFGIHLVKCLEIRPGKIGPRDARDAVREEATQFLFESLARKNRQSLDVRYLVDWPKPK